MEILDITSRLITLNSVFTSRDETRNRVDKEKYLIATYMSKPKMALVDMEFFTELMSCWTKNGGEIGKYVKD